MDLYPMIHLIARVERLTYTNTGNHFTIARVIPRESNRPVTIKGVMPGIHPGQTLKLSGAWETHPKYGDQFKVHSLEILIPDSVDGIRRYLLAGTVKGIGKTTAERLVRHFGENTLDVLESEPDRLAEVDGIGQTRAEAIHQAWKQHHALVGLMRFLQEHGVGTEYAGRILNALGETAVDILESNPFLLTEALPGIGFPIADAILKRRDGAQDDPRRIEACIQYLLDQSLSEGHTCLDQETLASRAEKHFDITWEQTTDTLDTLAGRRRLILESGMENPDNRLVFSPKIHRAETIAAHRLKTMMTLPARQKTWEMPDIANDIFQALGLELSGEQLAAMHSVLGHPVAIITGGPGTGKTTLIRSLFTLLQNSRLRVLLAAPTGRAARRLSEVTGREAHTIHRLLGYNFQDDCFSKNQDDPLDADAVIVDEASMVDIQLLYHLLQAIPLTARVIFVGDVFQLPSVGPGNVLADIIASDAIPVYHLTRIFRQAESSAIIVNAHHIRQGEDGFLSDFDFASNTVETDISEFTFIPQNDDAELGKQLLILCKNILPHRFGLDPVKDIQVLTPMHKGMVGTLHLNQRLQAELNSSPTVIEYMGAGFKIGDKVMHLKNNYQKDVFNGDIGTVLEFNCEKDLLTVDYYGRPVSYAADELHEISLAYAISVHKSQGSEYPAVIIPLTTRHYPLLQRNLLYTAVTRGRRLVILIGNPKALAIALRNDTAQKRLTRLAERLAAGVN